jgi:hypothetical protein
MRYHYKYMVYCMDKREVRSAPFFTLEYIDNPNLLMICHF